MRPVLPPHADAPRALNNGAQKSTRPGFNQETCFDDRKGPHRVSADIPFTIQPLQETQMAGEVKVLGQ